MTSAASASLHNSRDKPPRGRPPRAEPPRAELPGNITASRRRALQSRLLKWFAESQRPLPWREGYDPYAVWVSEMMLQQTQVDTVQPYYARWMARFPDIAALAGAPLEEVLKLWEGLGYYARARNLHRAAGEVVASHGGRLPEEPADLLALPGIGPYSAGAIASIAFNRDVAVVDGNVGRVLSRLFALDDSPRSTAGKAALWALAGELIPKGRARDFNQALMELGALICRPRDPACGLCPVREDCRAFAGDDPERYPVRELRPERRAVRAVLAVLERRGRLLMRRRETRGLWGGLWEFPWVEREAGEPVSRAFRRLLAELDVQSPAKPEHLGSVRHGLTHLQLEWDCLRSRVTAAKVRRQRPTGSDTDGKLQWVAPARIREIPLGRPMHKVLRLMRAVAG